MPREKPIPVTIRPARDRDAEALPAIENSAGTLFREIAALAWIADAEDSSVGSYRDLIAGGMCWVAADANDAPVGFLSAGIEGPELHIWELAVLRDCQRQGIGRALLEQATDSARNRKLSAITLTTFRNVPWNAPFYAAMGFRMLSGDAIGSRLGDLLRAEVERGLPADLRCAMRLALAR